MCHLGQDFRRRLYIDIKCTIVNLNKINQKIHLKSSISQYLKFLMLRRQYTKPFRVHLFLIKVLILEK